MRCFFRLIAWVGVLLLSVSCIERPKAELRSVSAERDTLVLPVKGTSEFYFMVNEPDYAFDLDKDVVLYLAKGQFLASQDFYLSHVERDTVPGRYRAVVTDTGKDDAYISEVCNGVTLTPIFLVYTMSSIALTFFVTAGVFLAMSIYGYTTKSDLTKFGSFMVMALIGLIVCSIINIFWANSIMDWIISFAGVAIFIGLTAWDTQKIKQMAQETDEANVGKLATLGALSLYLDFINLFLYLLRFLGSRE